MLPSVGQSPPTVEAFDGRRVANKVIASCDFDAYCCFILRQATGRRLWLNSRPNMTRSPTRLWPSTLRRIVADVDPRVGQPFAVQTRHWIGVKNLMWSTDYPHHRHDWPYSRRVIEESFLGVPDDEKHAMVCGNAMTFYGLE